MSRLLVKQYQAEVEKIIRYGSSKKETSIHNAFERLLNDYCKPRNYKIILDTETTLEGVPAIVWDYKLGNRSALEWILDQYKEKKPKDPMIAKLFNT